VLEISELWLKYFCDLLGNIILGRVSVFVFVLTILEHDLSVADLEDSGDMVIEHPTLHFFVYQPCLSETIFDLVSDRIGETFLVKRYFLLAPGPPVRG
jgi:hypothetical protein